MTTQEPESIQETKDAVMRYVDALNSHDLEAFAESVTDDVVAHGVLGVDGEIRGRDAYVEVIRELFEGYPDVEFEVTDVIAEGDMAAARWILRGTHEGSFGEIPATGNRFEIDANALFRVEDDKIAEKWYRQDDLGLLQQLEVDPANL